MVWCRLQCRDDGEPAVHPHRQRHRRDRAQDRHMRLGGRALPGHRPCHLDQARLEHSQQRRPHRRDDPLGHRCVQGSLHLRRGHLQLHLGGWQLAGLCAALGPRLPDDLAHGADRRHMRLYHRQNWPALRLQRHFLRQVRKELRGALRHPGQQGRALGRPALPAQPDLQLGPVRRRPLVLPPQAHHARRGPGLGPGHPQRHASPLPHEMAILVPG
jgi:hypothetical protein